jgi:serine/threonine protein kinase
VSRNSNLETSGLEDTLGLGLKGTSDDASVPETGKRIGPYRLLHVIGEGGMGEVWLAEQTWPVERKVALKLIKAGMDTRQVVLRFESERQALALMDHPAIAKVFDAGSTDEGRPYFVMEHVAGVPITEFCDTERLSTEERLALFVRVCDGVQHAHQKAILHRDLKPSNVQVARVDGEPQPKIIDFGISKALGERGLASPALATEVGVLLGTPEYMSPEQAEALGADVDTRADVYSLGVMLYQLLTGSLPFPSSDLRSQSHDEIRRILREVDPARPSNRVATLGDAAADVARNRQTEPGELRRILSGDLDAIALKAMDKDRGRRYGSASDLAADIGRYLQHEPVLARAPSRAYRVTKYIRRHRAAVAVTGTLLTLLLAFAGTTAVQARRIARERDRANREAVAAQHVSDFLVHMFNVSNPSEARGNSITARQILDRASGEVGTGLVGDPELQARMMDTIGQVYLSLGLSTRAEALLEQALAIRRRIVGPEARETLGSSHRLAMAQLQQGRTGDAESLLRETLQIRRRVLGPADPDTLASMRSLAWTLQTQGRLAEAEQLQRDALALGRTVLGAESQETLMSRINLGWLLQQEGKYPEAEALQSETLDIQRRILGLDHPDTLASATNLAGTLFSSGKIAAAEKLQRETLAIQQRVLGPEHPETLLAANNLAITLAAEQQLSEAEKLHRETLGTRRRTLGAEHPETGKSEYNLACVLALGGRQPEAISLLADALRHGLDTATATQMGVDTDLASLHGDPRFEALVAEGKRGRP